MSLAANLRLALMKGPTMTKFQPGDAVYVAGPTQEHIRVVEWTHPDGDMTVLFYPANKGEQEKVPAESVVYAHRTLKYFAYGHLPEKLQAASKPFSRLAHQTVLDMPTSGDPDQLSIALQKLLEAKDAAVRARLA